jgi:hypothetical protein
MSEETSRDLIVYRVGKEALGMRVSVDRDWEVQT